MIKILKNLIEVTIIYNDYMWGYMWKLLKVELLYKKKCVNRGKVYNI